ncbi:alpha-hydroxy-acid oxidizing protein [Geodermatophilus maliterrae]|uniref:Alpha-hydroxy-acid oxidizing protein n=1 Tax=Geodermatophilus maliterrae TaxID=3162531 RepID=A0ABV3X9T5_9ACTN
MTDLVTVEDYRRKSRRVLPAVLYDHLEGGAGDESLLARNRDSLTAVRLRPRYLRDVSVRDQRTTLFGRQHSAPLAIAPTGLNGAIRPGGDVFLARAAARAGIPFVLSTPAQNTIEEVSREADGDLWFQLYVVERGLAEELVARALAAGYSTLVLTVDVPVNGLRHRDRRNGFGLPLRMTPRILLDGARHPGWSTRFLRSGMPELANLTASAATGTDAAHALLRRQLDASFTWRDLAWLRRLWPHDLLVKGVLHPDDAARAVDCGADGIIVSNHGGRQLGEGPSTMEVLPGVLAKVDSPVLVDSGFRTGADIVKAVCLGASAVLIGRAALYGLAAGGEAGVDAVLDILRTEIDTTMSLIGATRIADLDRTYVQLPASWH